MDIQVENLGKKYGEEWIFRHLDIEIKSGSKVAITGSNGSGKSTLLKILSNFLSPSEGLVKYKSISATPTEEDHQLKFSLVAPYVNLINELTVTEFFRFHKNFRKSTLEVEELIEQCHLYAAKNKLLSELSSGMMQRLKLSLAFLFSAEIIFLDEPTSNLDSKGIDWYKKMIYSLPGDLSIIIASNQEKEYEVCTNLIEIEKFKPELNKL